MRFLRPPCLHRCPFPSIAGKLGSSTQLFRNCGGPETYDKFGVSKKSKLGKVNRNSIRSHGEYIHREREREREVLRRTRRRLTEEMIHQRRRVLGGRTRVCNGYAKPRSRRLRIAIDRVLVLLLRRKSSSGAETSSSLKESPLHTIYTTIHTQI